MSPGFKIFQTKPQVSEITLENGQCFSRPSANHPWPEVLLTRMNNRLCVAFYDTGITLVIRVYQRPDEYNVDFEVRVPQIFQNKTRGFLGNFDSEPSNEFYNRSGMILVPQPDQLSDIQIINIFESCKSY